MPDISIAVCTYNRAAHLNNCLQSLHRQITSGTFEVIIVDNASTDETENVAKRWVRTDPRFSYVFESHQGIARARNRALAQSSANVIAFTDDDATVSENWADSYIRAFSELDEDVFAIGGEIDPIFEAECPSWISDELLRALSAHLGWSDVPRFLREGEWLCEVNSAYRAESLRRHDGFPEELGRIGDLLLSGENFVNEAAKAAGLKEFFDPRIRVKHLIPASRLTKEWFRRRYFWQGVTASKLPDVASRRYGLRYPYLQHVNLPSTPESWINLVSDDTSDSEFNSACGRISELGYFLGLNKLISGR